MMALPPRALHRTMVQGELPATDEEIANDANRAAGPDGANAPRAYARSQASGASVRY